MKSSALFLLVILITSAFLVSEAKKKKSKKVKSIPTGEMKCLVCEALSREIDAYIAAIDPSKRTETGTFRVDSDGRQGKTIIPYARSQESLFEMVDKICERFEDYAQAKEKSSGKFSVIPLTTPTGNMNPSFGNYDVLPDDELNRKLIFHCQSIIEELEDDILDLYSHEDAKNLESKLCSGFCKNTKEEL
uniref:Canopy homolog 2 n=1 Tax=Caligus clemensi TaxID=344056 RepID=C1C0T7_CALCM|nr:canopy homolog 2 precursor [Caligus clemensi]